MPNGDQTKADETFLLEYISAATSASSRARTVIIVMLVASVYVFTQVRNADGWLDRRIEVRLQAYRLLEPPPTNTDAPIVSPKQEEKSEKIIRAETFIANNGYKVGSKDDRDRLMTQIKDLTKMRDEQLRLVRLPFFGAAFDANDMGIFAGITFTVVLFWLSLTIHRERRNLQIAFRVAEMQNQLRHCYHLLAMQQVLTMPPTRANRYWIPFGYISKALYLMPLGVYLWLFHHDWVTRHNGNVLGWDLMTSLLWTSKVCLLLIVILTFICIFISFRKDTDWSRYTEKVKKIPLQ